jgi:hypothetical protein
LSLIIQTYMLYLRARKRQHKYMKKIFHTHIFTYLTLTSFIIFDYFRVKNIILPINFAKQTPVDSLHIMKWGLYEFENH